MPPIDSLLLSDARTLAAYLIFAGSYFVFTLGKFLWRLRTLVVSFPNPHAGWLALAMASTLAGNLTITGSIANIIVVERAAADGVPIGFAEYVRVGVPITLVTLAVGTAWLW